MKILIVKTSSLGDILQTLPAVELIRHFVPGAKIDWILEKEAKDLLTIYSSLNRVFFYERIDKKFPFVLFQKSFFQELRKTRYDLLFDFQGNSKSGWITFLAKANRKIGFNIDSVAEWPNLLATNLRYGVDHSKNIRDQYLQLVEKFFQKKVPGELSSIYLLHHQEIPKAKKAPVILVAPFSSKKNKILPFNELLKPLLSLFVKDLSCQFIFLSGNAEERKIADSLHLAFEKNYLKSLCSPAIPELFSIIQNEVDLIIAADALPLHLASLSTIPKICFFGPSLSKVYAPQNEYCLSFQGQCPKKEVFEKRCPNINHCMENGCIRSFSPAQVWEKIIHWPFYLALKARS